MLDIACATFLFSAAAALLYGTYAVFHLVKNLKLERQDLELKARLSADAKVLSVSAICYLKTLYSKHENNEPTNPSREVILLAEQQATAVLVAAGINVQAYNLRTILEAIHILFNRKELT